MNKEMLENLFKNQLKDKLEFLEKRDNNELTCLKLLSTNMDTIKSIYYYIIYLYHILYLYRKCDKLQ